MLELLRDRFPNVAVSCSLFFSWTCRLTTYKRFPTGVFLERGEHLVDLVKSVPTNIYLKHLASIQPRTGLSKLTKNYKFRNVIRDQILWSRPKRCAFRVKQAPPGQLESQCCHVVHMCQSQRSRFRMCKKSNLNWIEWYQEMILYEHWNWISKHDRHP